MGQHKQKYRKYCNAMKKHWQKRQTEFDAQNQSEFDTKKHWHTQKETEKKTKEEDI